MKHLLLFLLLTSTALIAQERKQIQGTINGVLQEPLEGITIFNNTTLEGTVTNDMGIFYIDVRAGDNLSFNAVQYDPFILKITQATVDKGTTLLTFSEGVNLLDEVVVTDQSVRVAVKRTEMPDTGIDKVTDRNIRTPAVDRMENTFSDRVRQPEEIPVQQLAFNQSQLRYNSFNLVGLLSGLLVNGALSTVDLSVGEPNAQEKRFKTLLGKDKYSTEYLSEFLDLDEEHLYEFMVFANEQGLNKSMLQKDNEIELLQFLDEQATTFKARLAKNEKTSTQRSVKQ
ncbi:carboxypeptidase-like regulatory domain-containing protein [Nonlabens antarcticus]|uniref:carboxypeptidase-like regulatory domain-containing protein n=1 Tax=Nonlabens antarcticus TaxID=392714 RepID=UPI00189140FD|nr:carboxypeptidase-like regulatory domain-containing protein [Nonlabens antarcticus]